MSGWLIFKYKDRVINFIYFIFRKYFSISFYEYSKLLKLPRFMFFSYVLLCILFLSLLYTLSNITSFLISINMHISLQVQFSFKNELCTSDIESRNTPHIRRFSSVCAFVLSTGIALKSQGGLACSSPWGCKESDMTEWLNWTEKSSLEAAKVN